jgi:hypothetical protein
MPVEGREALWGPYVELGCWGATEQKTGLRNPVFFFIEKFHDGGVATISSRPGVYETAAF